MSKQLNVYQIIYEYYLALWFFIKLLLLSAHAGPVYVDIIYKVYMK